MNSKLYVGNVSYQAQEDELSTLFSEFGEVSSVKIIMDRMTGKAKGFAFVEMATSEMAQAAIDGLDGKEALGRNLRVSLAKEREPGQSREPRRGGFGGDRGGRDGGRGGRSGGREGGRGGFGGDRGRDRDNYSAGNSNGNRFNSDDDNFGNME